MFLVTGGLGFYTGYLLVYESYNKLDESFTKAESSLKDVKEGLEPSSRREVYKSYFGKPDTNCIAVFNSHRRRVPLMDKSVLLHFQTCPGEIKRILKTKPYQFMERTTSDYVGPSGFQDWFEPKLLGDTVLVYEHQDNNKERSRTIYMNPDSTEVFYADIYF